MKDVPLVSKRRFRVDGMDCAAGATKIDSALRRMPGIREVIVSVPAGTVTVTHDRAEVEDGIRRSISDLGSPASRIGAPGSGDDETQRTGHQGSPAMQSSGIQERAPGGTPWWRTRKGDLTIASGTALAVAFALGKAIPAIGPWAFLLAMMVGLVPIARRAVSAAMVGTPFSIEMLMTIAAVGAVLIGATQEAAAVVFLFLIGELLKGVAASRARASIQDLTEDRPARGRWSDPRGSGRHAFGRGHDPGASRRPDPCGRRHRLRRERDR